MIDSSWVARLAASACALALWAPQTARGETADEAAARFGPLPSVGAISLSPSGNRLAFVAPGPDGSEVLTVADLSAGASAAAVTPILHQNEPQADLRGCDFATEDRVVCTIDFVADSAGVLVGFSRVFAVGFDGKGTLVLSARDSYRALDVRQDGGSIVALELPGKANRLLMTRQYVPENSTGTIIANTQAGLGVDWVDLNSGAHGRVEGADRDATRYIADETGRVRLKWRRSSNSDGILSDRVSYHYRDATSDEWRPLSSTRADAPRGGLVPVAVDAASNVAYGFAPIDGFDAVVKVSLDGQGTVEPLVARKDVDVDSLVRIGRQQRVVGASYATERREVEYFVPELKRLAASLRQALPGQPLIDIVSASADEQKLLIVASSDVDPGTVYLYDKAKRTLNRLLAVRDQLADAVMGTMKAVTYPAADGTQIPAYLTLPAGSDGHNLPTIVMPHGGPGARDEWGLTGSPSSSSAVVMPCCSRTFADLRGMVRRGTAATVSSSGAPRSAM